MKKKIFLVALALMLVGGVGATFAYFSTSKSFSNEFETGKYGTTIKEQFVSPTNWQPGDVTNKKVVATNEGNVPIRVRVSYTETWVASNGTPLEETFGSPEERIALFTPGAKWIKDGNYYYYNEVLETNETTEPFIENVTFNSNFALVEDRDIECEPYSDADGYTGLTCTNTDTGYAGATYTLNINVETIQASAATNAGWTSLN